MTYADAIAPDFGVLWPNFEAKDYAKLPDEELERDFALKTEMEALARKNPIEYGWILDSWKTVCDNWLKYNCHVVLGGNRCLAGETPIKDGLTGVTRPISEWAALGQPLRVLAATTAGFRYVPAKAPFLKGVGRLWEISFSNNVRIRCVSGHRFLTARGWQSLSRLVSAGLRGEVAFHADSISEQSPCGLREDERHSIQIAANYRDDCYAYSHQYGELVLSAEGGGQVFSPSQFDAHRRGPHDWRADGRASKVEHNAREPQFCHPSTVDAPVPSCRANEQDSAFDEKHHCPYSLIDSCLGEISWGRIVSVLPSNVELYYDMEVPEWTNYVANGAVHANSSKSSFGAKLAIDLMEKIPECRIRAFQVNEEKSVAEQQAYVWAALPEKYKNLERRRGHSHTVQYSQANGFVGGKLILPPQPGYSRGAELIFQNFQQYRNDSQVVEGWWAHLVWCDEEVPQKMFERLLTRLYDAKGRMLLTFTTIEGWSPLIADLLGRTRTLERRHSDLLKRQLPVAQESITRPGTRIYYFWTQDNPFIPHDTIEKMRGRPEAEVLAIAHGIPTRSSTTKFPKFKDDVHIIKHENLPWEKAQRDGKEVAEFTRYHVIDPGGSKPWFMIWAAVDNVGRIFVYREWPDIGYGSWGEPSEKPEGSRGPAQKPNGFGIGDYVELIRNLEDGEPIFERIIDPRMGAAQTQGKEDATSIISELEDAGLVLNAAPGQLIDHGISLINDRLAYDENAEVSVVNSPKMFISDQCSNLIECVKNYTGCSREEVWKDGIDVLRYLIETGADFVDKQEGRNTDATFSY